MRRMTCSMPPASLLKTNSVLFVLRLSARADMEGGGSAVVTGVTVGVAATAADGVAVGAADAPAGRGSGL